MKTKEEKSKTTIIVVNKNLNKFSKINFFPERLKKANELLRKSGLPKINN